MFSPLTLVPLAGMLALNVFSSSPWMESGRAHYSALVLPFVAIGGAAGAGWLPRPGIGMVAGRERIVIMALALVAVGSSGLSISGQGGPARPRPARQR